MQVAGVIPNDNLKYILGTADTYIMDTENFVDIKAYSLDELNGYATIPVMDINNNEKRRPTKQSIPRNANTPK